MAGTAVAVGLVGCAAALALGLATVASGAVFGQRLAGVADAAALAAADAASGAVAGVPCERAEQIAAASGAVVETCELDGLIATVSVTARFGQLPAVARARAGPPS